MAGRKKSERGSVARMKTREFGLIREALDGLAPGEAALMLAAALREVYGGEWKITMSDKGKGSFTIESGA